jgi:hypothetical protein
MQQRWGVRDLSLWLGLHHLQVVEQRLRNSLGSLTSLSLLLNELGAVDGHVGKTDQNQLIDKLLDWAAEAAAANGGQPLHLRELLINSHLLGGAPLVCQLPAVVQRFRGLQRLGFCMPKLRNDGHRGERLTQQLASLECLQQLPGLSSLILFTKAGRKGDAPYQALLPTTLRSLAWQGDDVLRSRCLSRLVNLQQLWLHSTGEDFVKWEWQPLALLTRLRRLAVAVRYLHPGWFDADALAVLAPRLVDLQLDQLWAHDIAPLLQLSALTSLTALRLPKPIQRLDDKWNPKCAIGIAARGKKKLAPKWFPPQPEDVGQVPALAQALQALPHLKHLTLAGCKKMEPILATLSAFPALQQLRLEAADPWLLHSATQQYLTGIKGLTRLELCSTIPAQAELQKKGPQPWDLLLAPLTGLEYLQLQPHMLMARLLDHTWVSKLTSLHTLALTHYGQLAPHGTLSEAWQPVDPARPPGNPGLLEQVKMTLQHLAPSMRFLLLHGYTGEEVVQALRGELPARARLLHEPRNANWVRAASF